MAKTAISRRPRFNPTEYKEEFLDLAKTNPELAAEAATKLARRKRNQDDQLDDADESTTGLVAALGTFVITGAVGALYGSNRAKRDAILRDWEAEGAAAAGTSTATTPEPWMHPRGVSDPTKILGFPKLAIPPVVLAAIAGITAAVRGKKKRASTFERTMTMSAIGTTGVFIADFVASYFYKKKENKLASAADVTSIRAA